MLRYKHLRLDQLKIEQAKKILRARTETEAIDKALDRVIEKNQEKFQRKKLLGKIVQLREKLGSMDEDSADWLRIAREKRETSRDSGR
jgi:hypothetical protein